MAGRHHIPSTPLLREARGPAPPCGDHGSGREVEASGGDVRQVAVDLLVGGKLCRHQAAADLPYGRGLKDGTGR